VGLLWVGLAGQASSGCSAGAPSGRGAQLARPRSTRQATRPSAALALIVRAEQHGVPAVWSTVGGTTPDALTLFAAAATRTHQIALGTAIMPIYPSHPLVLADLAPGRLRLGLGPSHRPTIEGMFGLPFVQRHRFTSSWEARAASL